MGDAVGLDTEGVNEGNRVGGTDGTSVGDRVKQHVVLHNC